MIKIKLNVKDQKLMKLNLNKKEKKEILLLKN